MGGPVRAFAYPQFRLLWVSSLAFMISYAMASTARGWLMLQMTDSAFKVTAVQAVSWLPMLVVPLFGAIIVERLSRRMVLILSDVANMLILLTLALLIFVDIIQEWHVFALAVLHGVAFALTMPMRASSVPAVVDEADVGNGVALYTTIFSTSQLIGPTLAGYVMDFRPDQLGWAFLVGAILLVPAIGLVYFIRFKSTSAGGQRTPNAPTLASIGEALVYIRSSRLLIGLVLLGIAVAIFGMPYYTLMPVVAQDILHSGPDGLGLLGAAGGVGAIVGAAAVAFFSGSRWLRTIMMVGGMGSGLFLVLLGGSTIFAASFIVALALGLLLQLFYTGSFTLVQVASPSEIRARVFGTFVLAMGISPLGMFLIGVEAELIGPRLALAVTGAALFVLLAGLALAIPEIRRIAVVR